MTELNNKHAKKYLLSGAIMMHGTFALLLCHDLSTHLLRKKERNEIWGMNTRRHERLKSADVGQFSCLLTTMTITNLGQKIEKLAGIVRK